MKKFLGVMVAVALCFCMIVPSAFAADTDYLASLKDAIGNAGADANLDDLSQALDGALQNVGLGSGSDASSNKSAPGGIGDVLSGLSGMIDPDSFSAISDALGGLIGGSGNGSSSFDISSLMDTISGAFSGMGFDLGSLTKGFDLGSFDFSSILGGLGNLGGGDSKGDGTSSGTSGAMDAMSGIMDKLMSGLSALGIDTSAIEGLLDNDIVNFFANMYIGLGEIVKPEVTTTAEASTTKPAVVTTKTPKTGDTSAVFVALGVLAVAAGAAFVCLKKKKD